MGKESETIKTFKSFLKEFPDSSLSPDIQFWLGEYYFNKKLFSNSLKEYQALVEHYPDCSLVDDALFWGAKASRMLGDHDIALELLEKMITQYSNSDMVADAEIEKADIYYQKKEYASALPVIERVIKNYSNSYLYLDAKVKKAYILKEMNHSREALKIMEEVLTILRKEKRIINSEWIWKAVRLYEESGQKEKAVKNLMILINGHYDSRNFKKAIHAAKDIFVSQGKYQEAAALLKKLLKEGKNINKIPVRREIRKLQTYIEKGT